MDKLNKEKRSWNMSRIHSRNTHPEIANRRCIFSRGLRFRIYYNLPGKPDIVFPKQKLAVFINGCFWHSHGCKNSGLPKSNTSFWKDKLEKNVERDYKTLKKLKTDHWKTLIIWECQIEKDLQKSACRIERLLKNWQMR